jgi:subtilase family serine protease
MSYGFHEDQVPINLLATYDSEFTTPANHVGISFLASSGDDGAGVQQRYPNNIPGENGLEPPEYPSISPNVIGVGGTTLIYPNGATSFAYPGVATSPNGVGESAWGSGSLSYNRNDSPGGGTGGGISLLEGEPSYQSNYGLGYFNGSFNARTTPDVSLNADGGNSPVLIYDSWDTNIFNQPVGWTGVGGTSFSAPAWAALIAIADEARAANNEGSLDGPTIWPPAWVRPSRAASSGTCGVRRPRSRTTTRIP